MNCSDLNFSSLFPYVYYSVKLKAFQKFENTTDALSAVTGIVEGKLPKNLKKFLESEISDKEMKKESLIICDPKLGKLKHNALCISVLKAVF